MVGIEGDPSFTLELNFGGRWGATLCAMPVVNAIPAVCEARPGLHGPLDLPRDWTRNAPARLEQAAS